MSTPYFDFDSLPDELIVLIFGYLPFKDQVRQSGISRRFYQLSKAAIAQRKTLILDEDLMHYVLWSRPFGALLQECSPILEKIVSTNNVSYWCPMTMEPIFQFSYSKLAEIEIRRVFDRKLSEVEAEDLYDSCLRMIGESPNLKRFTLDIHVEERKRPFEFRFPNSVKSTNLKYFAIYCCDNESFESMAGAVPNLKNLKLGCNCAVDCSGSDGGVLDNFFATTPLLEKVTLKLRSMKKFDLETYFLRLPLKSLQLQIRWGCDENVSDQIIEKISTFPNLETLALDGVAITDAGFRAISSLRALRCLDLVIDGGSGFQMESVEFLVNCLEYLVNCVELEKFKLFCSRPLPLDAFVTLIRSCQKLNTILCRSVRGVESIDAVLQILPSFANVKRRIKIGFTFYGRDAAEIWKSEAVSAALQQLKENGGAEIEFFDGTRYMREFME